MRTAAPFSYEVPGWLPGTRHYMTNDGRCLAVQMFALDDRTAALLEDTMAVTGEAALSSGAHTIVVPPTHIVECRFDGTIAGDAIPAPIFTANGPVSHEEALQQAGYTVGN